MCQEAGLEKAPEFIQEEIFKTILWRKNAEVIDSQQLEVGVNEGVNEGVTELLRVIANNPGKRVPFFEKVMAVPSKTIERWINQLKKENKIEFKGAPKTGGYWKINNNVE